MLIRSQDRKMLVPVGELTIRDSAIYQSSSLQFQINLGHYDSESRCLEILDEIEKIFGNYLKVEVNTVPTQLFDYPKVYQMPEK